MSKKPPKSKRWHTTTAKATKGKAKATGKGNKGKAKAKGKTKATNIQMKTNLNPKNPNMKAMILMIPKMMSIYSIGIVTGA